MPAAGTSRPVAKGSGKEGVMATVVKKESAALPLAEVLGAYRVMLTSRRVDDKEIQLKQ
jgi:TPP-dependent pyruvate/acetoin dehydrogenase alpha subunit